MNRRIILSIFLLLFCAEAIAVYWFKLGFDTIALRETLYLIPPLFAIIAGMVVIRTFGMTGSRSLSLIFLTAGISYWFLGEVLFSYYEYILHINPYPSIPDFFYVLAYPMLLLGLLNEIQFVKVNWKNIAKTTLFIFSLIALVFIGIIGYFGIYKAYIPDESLMMNAFAIGYGVGDFFLLLTNILLLLLIWEFRGSRLARVWSLLLVGFLSILIGDILFALYRTEYNMQVWFYKSLLDSFWMAGYLFFAAAFFELSFSLKDAYKQAVLNAQNKGLPTPQQSAPPPTAPVPTKPEGQGK